MSAVTALKLRFETLLSTRPVLQGNDMEGGRNEHVLGPPLVLLGGSDNFPVLCPQHRSIHDYVQDFSDDFHAEVSSIFFELPKISFSILIGTDYSQFKHEAAEMQRGGRTCLQSCGEPGTESALLFFLKGASHQKLPWRSGMSECLDFLKIQAISLFTCLTQLPLMPIA